jgi:WD40 repeat protein
MREKSVSTDSYLAFISYSHRADHALAIALERGIERLAVAWYKRSPGHVFRDDSDLTASPSLWPDIQMALQKSTFLIVLASPDSAVSKWVDREIRWWLENKSVERLLLGVTRGAIYWNETQEAFDEASSTALPSAVRNAFISEPRWIDLREMEDPATFDLQNPAFADHVAEFAAKVRGVKKERLIGEEFRQRRRWTRLRNSALAVLGTLTTVAIIASIMFLNQRNEAQRQTALAEAREFAARAGEEANPYVAVTLAIEAMQRTSSPIPQARSAYLRALTRIDQLAFKPSTPNLPQHNGPVVSIAWSNNSRLAASVGADGSLAVWDRDSSARGGSRIDTAQVGRLTSACFTLPDDNLVAVGPQSSLLHWDPREGARIVPLPPVRTGDGGLVACSSDGRVAVTRSDNVIRIMSASGSQLLEIQPPPVATELQSIDWSPDGRWLAASDHAGAVRIWDATSGTLRNERLGGSLTTSSQVKFSPDGAQLMTTSSWGIAYTRIWAIDNTEQPTTTIGVGSSAVAWAPDSRTIAVVSAEDSTLRQFDAQGGAERGAPLVEGGTSFYRVAPTTVAWARDGISVMTGHADGSIRFWQRKNSPSPDNPPDGALSDLVSLTWSPDGARVVAAGTGAIQTWRADSGQPVGPPSNLKSSKPASLEWSPTESVVATVADDGAIVLLNAETNQETKELRGQNGTTVLAWSQGGPWLVSGSTDGSVWLWDVAAGVPIGPELGDRGDAVVSTAFLKGGTEIGTVSNSGVVSVWRFSDGARLKKIEVQPQATIDRATWSPTGDNVALYGFDQGISFVDIPNESVRPVVSTGRIGNISDLTWSPEGSLVGASALDSGTIWILDAASGDLLGTLNNGEGKLFSVRFSPDGTRLAVGTWNSVTFWKSVQQVDACRDASNALGADRIRSLLGLDRPVPSCASNNSLSIVVALPAVPARAS